MSGGNMGSVRERRERELETPEIVVPTSNRRVALAAGGSVSTRQTQERRNDANNPEVAAPREVTSSASVGFEQGSFSRVRDRQVVAEAMKPEVAQPKTAIQIAGDAGIAEHNQRQAAKTQEEAQAYATGKKVDAYERKIAEARAAVAAEVARQRKAQHDFLEAAVIREAEDLTPEETQIFWLKLVALNACLDAGKAAIVAEEIRLNRK
jgi:hypothetical protein